MQTELLAPAGNMKKLETALLYGADAVYVGGKHFGLRAMSDNFTDEELKKATEFTHTKGKKIYVTINIFARSNDFEDLKKYLKFLESIKVDAIIVSDLGVLRIARETTKLEIHISTQANILNKYTAEEYIRLGASRVILARECSLTEIREITTHLYSIKETEKYKAKGKPIVEVFVHGAMCVSYSGRCLLSSYMIGANRDANRGACVQACRFKYTLEGYEAKNQQSENQTPYYLKEEKRPNEHFPISEDQNGTYIMNSHDLSLAEHVQDLIEAGVASLKIEGRTKSEYYVAGAVNTYRKLLNGENFDFKTELEKISHRPYTTGFLLGTPQQHYQSASPHATYEFIAYCPEDNLIEQRNAFNVGDTLEILSPRADTFNKTFTVTRIETTDGIEVSRAKRVQEMLKIECPYPLRKGDILRRKVVGPIDNTKQ